MALVEGGFDDFSLEPVHRLGQRCDGARDAGANLISSELAC